MYGFAALFPKNVGALERLEAVGLARPFLIRRLFDLRNDIEHRDAAPPDLDRCLELADVTWYFLKSTDYACKVVPAGVILRGTTGVSAREPELWLNMRFDELSEGEMTVTGWVSPAEISDEHLPGNGVAKEVSVTLATACAHA